MIVVLTGGTGGAKLIQGLYRETEPGELLVVCNTGDDLIAHGLYVSPDLDTILYTLAGVHDPGRGWGIQGDSFTVLEWLEKYGEETWFKIGDRDLATHLFRSRLIREGLTLSQVTERMAKALEVKATVMPMSDQRVETKIATSTGWLSFQEYFVREHWSPDVREVVYSGAAESRPAPGVLEAIRGARAVVLCPSNPVTSIAPVLAIPGIREALRETPATVAAVSPIIGRAAVSGPADRLMPAAGLEPSALGVAEFYRDFLDLFFIAPEDSSLQVAILSRGVKPVPAPIRMASMEDKRRLAREVLDLL
jgi:LPPG:FO 2-phospho-L-lactate transferase